MRMPLTLALALVVALAGCGSGGGAPSSPSPSRPSAVTPPGATAPPSSGPPVTARDWPTYHRDGARTGAAPSTPAAGPLSRAWTRKLDGAVYAQPLVIGDLVVAATEGDSLYALDRSTGRVRWRVHVGTPVPLSGLPCGDIDPLGITGTPVYDPATGLVYAVAETTGYHPVLVGVAVGTGRLRVRRDIPAPDGHPRFDQQRAALALAHGRVYVAFGGLNGDCGPYRGAVVGVPASGAGPLVSYVVPTTAKGGIWAAGGPVTGPGGDLYVSVGNGAATSPPFDHSDSVTRLSPGLRRTGVFAPSTWAADNAADLDLGSMSPALLADGKILAVGKRGAGYLLNAASLGGVGGQVTAARVCHAYGGASVRGTVAYVPCEGGGMAAVDTAGGRVSVRWRGPPQAAGSPVLGGGAVWVADWNAGLLYQLAPSTGHVQRRISLGSPLPHFASPSLSGKFAFLGTMNGVTAISGA